MTQPVIGVPPAPLSQENYQLLNGLRGFRHFFRHAYGLPIEYAQLLANLDKAHRLRSQLHQDVKRFLQTL